jgi:hypothetical protein
MYPVAGNFFLVVGVPYRFRQFPSERSGIRKISPNFIRPVNFNVGTLAFFAIREHPQCHFC